MVAPAYTEISHFRAPYKNWPHLGPEPSVATTGANAMMGYGQDTTAAAAMTTGGAAPAAAPAAWIFATDAKGIRVFTPQAADAVLTMMQGFSVIFLTNDAVKLDVRAPGDIRQSASNWIQQKLKEGKSIVAGSPAGINAFVSPIVIDRTLEAVAPSAEADKAGAATLPLTAVLARPAAGLAKAGLLGPLGMAAVALVAVGLVAYLATRKPSRARKNPRRSRRRRARRSRR